MDEHIAPFVVCHELGHVVGLGHSPISATVGGPMDKHIALASLAPGDVMHWAGSHGGAIVTYVEPERDGSLAFALAWRSQSDDEWHVSTLVWSTARGVSLIARLRPSTAAGHDFTAGRGI